MIRHILLIAALLVSRLCFSQTATGSWYGKADVMATGGNANNYLTELIIRQKGDEVEGIFGYYFKDSYQSFFIRGTYDKKTRQVSIKNLPILFYRSDTRNGIECPMNFQGTLMVSKVSSSLKGSFYTEDRYKYTCPELRVSYLIDTSEKDQAGFLRNAVAGKKFWKPQEEDYIVTSPSGKETRTVNADITSGGDTVTAVTTRKTDVKKLVEDFSKRKNTYSKDLEVISDSVRISFYDNGDIDGDSISVFLNNMPVLAKKELNSRALNLYLSLDSTREVNEVSMFAENLGEFPPNTALMIVTDGVNRYEVYLSSSLKQNATVRLRKKK